MRFWKFFKSESGNVGEELRRKYASFQRLLTTNNDILREITELEGVLAGGREMSLDGIKSLTKSLNSHVEMMVEDLNVLADGHYRGLQQRVEKIAAGIENEYHQVHGVPVTRLVIPLEGIVRELSDAVGGKNSNLGEVRNRVGLPVPQGFAVTSFAYRSFVEGSGVQGELDESDNRI